MSILGMKEVLDRRHCLFMCPVIAPLHIMHYLLSVILISLITMILIPVNLLQARQHRLDPFRVRPISPQRQAAS
jgi:hypothetical protein